MKSNKLYYLEITKDLNEMSLLDTFKKWTKKLANDMEYFDCLSAQMILENKEGAIRNIYSYSKFKETVDNIFDVGR